MTQDRNINADGTAKLGQVIYINKTYNINTDDQQR